VQVRIWRIRDSIPRQLGLLRTWHLKSEGPASAGSAAAIDRFNALKAGDRLLGRLAPMWRPLPLAPGERPGAESVPPLLGIALPDATGSNLRLAARVHR
jgi:hypothetical protein